MKHWGFTYKTNVVWHKVRKDGGPDGCGLGFYFRNVTELLLFGTQGKIRTAQPGRTQVNFLATRKREHSRKPEELYNSVEACSYGPFLGSRWKWGRMVFRAVVANWVFYILKSACPYRL